MQSGFLPLLRAAVAWEWRDHGRFLVTLILTVFAVGFTFGALVDLPREMLVPFVLGALPAAAAIVVPASVVDDTASGFTRLVATCPVPRGAYVLLRATGLALLIALLVLPFAIVAAFLAEGIRGALLALPVLALVVAWMVAMSFLLGLAASGPGVATGLWFAAALFSLYAAFDSAGAGGPLSTGARLLHALPGPAAVEALADGPSPWRFGALPLLAAQTAAVVGAAALFAARGWRSQPGQAPRAAGLLVGIVIGSFALTLALPGVSS